jgi:hypothetical protein
MLDEIFEMDDLLSEADQFAALPMRRDVADLKVRLRRTSSRRSPRS